MNKIEPSAKPTTMASVNPTKIVSRNVTTSTAASPRERPKQRGDGVPLDHVPRDDGEHAGERRQRDEARERRREQHEREQKHRMQHAGDGSVCAGAHVRRRARDRARHADAAEQTRRNVGGALRDELAVAAVPAARHAVGDDRRQQRLDRAEQREGNGARQHLAHLRPKSNVGQRRHRQPARNAAELRADRRDVELRARRDGRGARDGDQHARPLRAPPPHADDDGDRRERQRDRRAVVRRQSTR